MNDIHQLIKRGGLRYDNIFPNTYTEAITDKASGKTLAEILNSFNMYFLAYDGNMEHTRLQVPLLLRRRGLWVTYAKYDKTIINEWYNGELFDDINWSNNSNWIKGNIILQGEITISSKNNWVINGIETDVPALGKDGNTPKLRIYKNKWQVSYNNESTWTNLSMLSVFTLFRINNNKLEMSMDLGGTWDIVSDYISHWFRINDNKLEISNDNVIWTPISDPITSRFRINKNKLEQSTDLGKSWTPISGPIAAKFKFTGITGQGLASAVGKIQYSLDEGLTWADLSDTFTNNLYIKGYVTSVNQLPVNAVLGDIYGVGPTYDANDTGHVNPIYNIYVRDNNGWRNNGRLTPISFNKGISTESLRMGNSTQRPNGVEVGYIYKDTTLNKWIIWNGTNWENIDGTQSI